MLRILLLEFIKMYNNLVIFFFSLLVNIYLYDFPLNTDTFTISPKRVNFLMTALEKVQLLLPAAETLATDTSATGKEDLL